jgi:hypothetical protein
VVRVRPRATAFRRERPRFMAQSHRQNGVTVTYGLPLSQHAPGAAHPGPLIIHIPPPRRGR